MTKDEALQKVNDYCNERSYTTATLTDGFKDKFAEHFAKRYPDAQADDETATADLKFALNTAFSGASLIITEKTNAFETKENDYKAQIEELQKKIANGNPNPPTPPAPPKISPELQAQLDELQAFKDAENKRTKLANIMDLAKANIRQDLHKSFEKYAAKYNVLLDKGDEEQANGLVSEFQDIFKDSIGDIKPMKPQATQKRDEDILSSLAKITI